MRTTVTFDPAASRTDEPYTRSVSLGTPLLPDVDDVSEVLALIEGESHGVLPI
jgi:hypothetical protein